MCVQTIKCLLIVPNPESALNEEAGRLLLERYEDYAKHAKLMTSIHATTSPTTSELSSDTNTAATPTSPKKAKSKDSVNPTTNVKKPTTEKKKTLKRL
jgi:ubiquitin-conjugating enzyme E2 S